MGALPRGTRTPGRYSTVDSHLTPEDARRLVRARQLVAGTLRVSIGSGDRHADAGVLGSGGNGSGSR